MVFKEFYSVSIHRLCIYGDIYSGIEDKIRNLNLHTLFQ